MPLTILFDLDETLLSTYMNAFQPAYFHGLGTALADLAPAEDIANQILKAVAVMHDNQDPCWMLEEIFSENFYPPLGGTEEVYRQALNDFYHNEFPKLKKVTQVRPEARELIDWCKSENITMAIATNPLFPRTATRQRIEWAGLDPSDFVFFSSFNDFHFTKPNLTYYAECLGRLGWPEGNIVMVGDNLSNDLLPMREMGFATYWVTSYGIDDPHPHGTLADVQGWLETQQAIQSAGLLDSIEVDQAILRSTPAVFDSWIKMLPMDLFKMNPAKDEWNLTEILWHLAEMEQDVYLPQWQRLLEKDDPLISWPDTSHWAGERGYHNRSVDEGLKKFCTARMESEDIIKQFQNKHLMNRSIRHTTFSQTTIRELISFSARHDRIHLHQSMRILDFYKIY